MYANTQATAQLLAEPPINPVRPPVKISSRHEQDQDQDLAAALTEARAVLDEQRSLAQAMRSARDPKHYYLHLCALTTQALLAGAAQLSHAGATLRLQARLHIRFLHNLRRWLSPGLGQVDAAWQSAFQAFDLAGEATSVFSVLTGLHLALRAQLEHDLPHAVAQTLREESSEQGVDLRADLHKTSQAMRAAVEQLLTQTAEPHLPKWLARPGARLLGETLERLLGRYLYNVVGHRARGYARGVKLAGKAVAAPAPAPAAKLPGLFLVRARDEEAAVTSAA